MLYLPDKYRLPIIWQHHYSSATPSGEKNDTRDASNPRYLNISMTTERASPGTKTYGVIYEVYCPVYGENCDTKHTYGCLVSQGNTAVVVCTYAFLQVRFLNGEKHGGAMQTSLQDCIHAGRGGTRGLGTASTATATATVLCFFACCVP